MRDAQRQLRALGAKTPEAAAPLRASLLYLRDRVGVPRDMSFAEARELRALLTSFAEALRPELQAV